MNRRTLQRIAIAPVVALVACLVIALHAYLAGRLLLEPQWPTGVSRALLGVMGLLGACLFAAPVAERLLPPARARWLAWPAALWMGFAFLLLAAVAASDGLLWLLGMAGDVSAEAFARGRALLTSAVALGVGGLALRGGLGQPAVRRLELSLPRWPQERDGYRIVQISDIHIGAIRGADFADALARRASALAPDLMVVTGDLVDGSVEHLRDEVAPFAQLSGRDGVFFVTGNHDFYSGADAWCARVSELGMRPLRNQRITIGTGAGAFDLAGVDDHHGNLVEPGGGEDVEGALAGWDRRRPLILLAHDPSTFKRAARHDIDLQLSGHTHGGQIWPFHLLVRAFLPFVAGVYRSGRSTLFVSRGTGFWGPPMRLGAPAEITEIVLRSAAS